MDSNCDVIVNFCGNWAVGCLHNWTKSFFPEADGEAEKKANLFRKRQERHENAYLGGNSHPKERENPIEKKE